MTKSARLDSHTDNRFDYDINAQNDLWWLLKYLAQYSSFFQIATSLAVINIRHTIILEVKSLLNAKLLLLEHKIIEVLHWLLLAGPAGMAAGI